jgi:hypothetical protein
MSAWEVQTVPSRFVSRYKINQTFVSAPVKTLSLSSTNVFRIAKRLAAARFACGFDERDVPLVVAPLVDVAPIIGVSTGSSI